MTFRILLAVSGSEDILFLQEVLTEVDGREYWSDWVHLETVHAATWDEAEAILAQPSESQPVQLVPPPVQPVDLLLLDMGLQVLDAPAHNLREPRRGLHQRELKENSRHGVEAFRRAQTVAPQVPVVLLIDPDDMAVAELLLREGAQDFLVKSQVDCGPLAHAIRNAIERHRYLESARAAAMTDPLTGLLNRAAFFALAERDRKLALSLDRRMLVAVAEPDTVPSDGSHRQQDRDMVLVEAAERLRKLAGPMDLVARIGESSFAIAVSETEERALQDAWSRLNGASASLKLNIGASVFRPESPDSLEALLEQAGNAQRGSALHAVHA